jgi:hypothetical protein
LFSFKPQDCVVTVVLRQDQEEFHSICLELIDIGHLAGVLVTTDEAELTDIRNDFLASQSQYLVLLKDYVLTGPDAINHMRSIIEISKEHKENGQIGIVSAQMAITSPTYRFSGFRALGNQAFAVPYKEILDGFVLLDRILVEDNLDLNSPTTHWIVKCRDHGLEVATPYDPCINMQIATRSLERYTVDDGRSLVHKDKKNLEVVIPFFNRNDFLVRDDREWHSTFVKNTTCNLLSSFIPGDPKLLEVISNGLKTSNNEIVPTLNRSGSDAGLSDHRLGVAILGCARGQQLALTLVHLIKYAPKNIFISVLIDKPVSGEHNQVLLKGLQFLLDKDQIQKLVINEVNKGLNSNVTQGITELAISNQFEYLLRLEDDMLVGPDILQNMMEVFELSSTMNRPMGILSGQVAQTPKSIRPTRFRVIKRFTVGLHAYNNLEGCTMLRAGMQSKGFSWALDHPRAMNVSWIDRARAYGFDTGTIITPVQSLQNIGYTSTLGYGHPIVPARAWDSGKVIQLPEFDFDRYYEFKEDQNQQNEYCRSVIEQFRADVSKELITGCLSLF